MWWQTPKHMKFIEVIEIVNPEQVNSSCIKRGDLFISKKNKIYISLNEAKNDGFIPSKIKIIGIPIRIRMSTNIETFK